MPIFVRIVCWVRGLYTCCPKINVVKMSDKDPDSKKDLLSNNHTEKEQNNHTKKKLKKEDSFGKYIGNNHKDDSSAEKTNIIKLQRSQTGTEFHAHGDISFRGITRSTKAKFIRIADKQAASEAWKLMQEKWKLNAPSLIVSVTGAATDFSMNEKLASSFKSTILKVSQLTNACIITGGKYGGVTRLVSDALEKSDIAKSSGFSCMGVANWDKISQKEIISEGKPYVTGSWLTQKSLNLDYKHTHFLLVKNVTRKDTESLLRGNLERYIVEKYNAPAVRVIMNGGVNVLNTIYELVSQPDCYPVVIVQNSGRIADVVAYGLRNCAVIAAERDAGRRHHVIWQMARDVLYDKYGPIFGGDDIDGWFETCYERLLYCCLERKDMFVMTETGDVDAAVMAALLHGLQGTETEAFEKMKLTLLWDRADFARANIFKSSLKVKIKDLRYILLMALARGNHEYVKLLMDYGVNMHEILTVGILEWLYGYQALEDGSPLRNKTKNTKHFIAPQGVGINEADRKSRKSLGREHVVKILNSYLNYEIRDDVSIFNVIEDEYDVTASSMFQDPFWELFLWAVICNLPKMATFFWPFGKNQMAKALIAADVMKHMSEQPDLKEETREIMIQTSESSTTSACKLLEQCYASDPERATSLVTTTVPSLHDMTCLDLAAVTHQYEFVANNSIQSLLDDVWTGRMKTKQVSTSYYMNVLFNMFFPLHINDMIELPTDTDNNNDNSYDDVKVSKGRNKVANFFRKFAIYHITTPIVTYLWHVLSHFFFLFLYAYHLTMTDVGIDPNYKYTGWDYLLYVWVLAYAMGELYHITTYDLDSFRKKFMRWFSDGYNKYDFFNNLCFWVAAVLSLCDSPIAKFSHTLNAINCALWLMRVLTVLRIHETLGLYIQMILAMLSDLLWFLVIMFFVVLAYAILSTALLYPGPTHFYGHLKLFMRAWFAIYGEHFIDPEPDPPYVHNQTHPVPIHSEDAEFYNCYIVYVVLGFYLLFTNILLLNIIIAAFNTTYERILSKANHISKFGKYLVIVEASRRTVSAPPPLSLVYHFFLFFRWVYRRTCCCRRRPPDAEVTTKLCRKQSVVTEQELEELAEFEYFCARQVYQGNSVCEGKVGELGRCGYGGGNGEAMEEMKENLNSRMKGLEEKLDKITRVLTKRLDSSAAADQNRSGDVKSDDVSNTGENALASTNTVAT